METSVQEPIENYPKEYVPSTSELLKQHAIRISFLSRGCLIEVGCKTIPFENIEVAMKALNEYVADPYTQTKIWEKILN
jgi:hypothetical protein